MIEPSKIHPAIRLKFKHWIFRIWPVSNYEGMVIGRWMLFKRDEAKVHPALIDHELVHQVQMNRHGMLQFYLIYMRDYFKNLLRYRNHQIAYRSIPFEIEAYKNGEMKHVQP